MAATNLTNAGLWARRESASPRGVTNALPVFVERAAGAEIWDVEGKHYIDFAAGIAVLNTGHNHPVINTAVAAQMEKFGHVGFQVTPYAGYVELAERLNQRVPGASPKKTLFVTTGAEATENAVKIARAHTGRPAIIAFSGGFHGRTMMGMALTGKVVPYKVGFGPLPGDVHHIPYPIPYHGISEAYALAALERLFHADVDPSCVAAIIIEPVQGEGGFYPAPHGFLKTLRSLCDQHGIVLVIDEVQTGFARTGTLFCHEQAGIEADLVPMAKSLGAGFPIAAVTGKAEIMDAAVPGGLGGTFAGSPLACAAALAVLDVIDGEKLCERAVAIGGRLKSGLAKLRDDGLAVVGDIRGPGAMVALELVNDSDANKPAAALTKTTVAAGGEEGLLLLACGYRGNVIRLLPPLTASDEVIDEGLRRLGAAIERALATTV
ncbi:MAG: 4-aminobutyrate--2-oxoglutarate transaminase [Sphingorhabdus sp.]